MSDKINTILEAVDNLTVLELAELVKAFETKYDVTAAAPVAMMAGPAASGGAAPAEEEKTEFDVLLENVGDKKIQVIKVVRELTNLGLKEAKDLVEGTPSKVKEGVSKADAESAKTKLEEVGATVAIK